MVRESFSKDVVGSWDVVQAHFFGDQHLNFRQREELDVHLIHSSRRLLSLLTSQFLSCSHSPRRDVRLEDIPPGEPVALDFPPIPHCANVPPCDVDASNCPDTELCQLERC